MAAPATTTTTTTTSVLQEMLRDAYANYVVQKVIELATRAQLEVIVRDVRLHIGQIKHYTYGRHIIAKLEKATGLRLS